MRSLLALLVVAGSVAPMAAQTAFTTTVDVSFFASYSLVAGNVDDFTKQVSVMLLRTSAVTADDISSVKAVASPAGNILVTITLKSLQNGLAVTKVIQGRHLSVYVGGKGYIAVIANTVEDSPMNATDAPVTTTGPMDSTNSAPIEATTRSVVTTTGVAATTIPTIPKVTVSTVSTPSTTSGSPRPSGNGYVWLHEYTSDNENINDCSTGNAWSGIVISRMPEGCNRFEHALTKQDEYNFLEIASGSVEHFGMICDTNCKSCISRVDNFSHGSCVQTWGGSVAITSSASGACYGATYLGEDEGTVSVLQYSMAGCDLKKSAAGTLYIRNYPAFPQSGNTTCVRDGTSNSFYALKKAINAEGNVSYDGVFGCSDSDCTLGCLAVNAWQSGQCYRGADGNGISFAEADKVLNECIAPESSKGNDVVVKMASADENSNQTTTPEPTTTTVEETTVEPSTTRVVVRPTETAANKDTETVNGGDGHPEDETVFAILIAGGGVLAVSFLVAGVVYSRKHRQREIETMSNNNDDADDALYNEYDYNGYSKYGNYDAWEDDRLVTDI